MAGNQVVLEFAGDATKLQRAAKKADAALTDVGNEASTAFDNAGQEAKKFEDRIGSLGSGVTGMTDAVDAAGGSLQAVADIQDYARERASRLARAANDVKQAHEDAAQATRDLAQAQIDADQSAVDLEQALLDQKTAQEDYNAAVKEHGARSNEARQAQIDLKQAGVDVKQAHEDAAQATRDASQANIDAEAAQLDLNDAMHEAKPPELQEWADKLGLLTGLLTPMVGIIGLVTAAQWLWNTALFASPVTWIVLGIVALIAIVVLLVKHWDKVKEAGGKAWKWIKDKASEVWDWLKKVPGWIGEKFGKIAGFISRPFRAAFNFVADAWNNTIGRLSWTVPNWIPFIGGNTISVPNLPKFHTGGVVPGAPGTEVPIMAMAGETVVPAGRGGDDTVHVTVKLDREVLINAMAKGVRRRGGSVQFALGGLNA